MRNELRLFINGEEIEFGQDPKILLNFKETELHNPTIVRNSFTKQIQIEGTNANNDVFGHIWDLTRIQDGNFNPIKKTDFKLFVNDELFQKGYCKLDKVTRTNNTIQYSLTLYGGLGSFFYNLTYDQDDSSNAKKTLASLKFHDAYSVEPNLDFTIDKDNVYEAWGQLAGYGTTSNPRWDIINFAPALNGIPTDFDADKVLINNYLLNQDGASGFIRQKTDGGITYKPVLNGTLNDNGYSLGELSEELQEWQTRDLRCYNQRPIVSMYNIIQACCQPDNNGGFQVKLDEHFFHQNNPYYYDSWVTMPLLKDLEGVQGGETYRITGATVSTASSQTYGQYMYQVIFDTPSLASINNINMNLTIGFTPSTPIQVRYLYPYHTWYSNGFTLLGSTYVRELESNQGVIVQLFAIGQAGEIVGQSKAYLLSGQKNWNQKDKEAMWEWFRSSIVNEYGTEPEFEFMEGYFTQVLGNYVWCNRYGQPTGLNFSFSAPNNFASIMLKVTTPFSRYISYEFTGNEREKHASYSVPTVYTSRAISTTGNHTSGEAIRQDSVTGKYTFSIAHMDGIATDYEGLFSGTKITKERLLTTKHTPADYLLSYCKMFGLYFYYDSTEEADDPELYPAGVIHIMDRDTFYTDEVVDLSKMIDWNKNVEITPAMAATKWYSFDTEHVESELDTGYKQQYGKSYGAQLVNTNYNFDSETTNLYDGNVFKSGIMALEKDKYYKKAPNGLPVYQYNGLKYSLFSRTGSTDEFQASEIEYPVKTTIYMDSVNPDYEFYDAFPKLQLHGEDNAPAEGEDVLLFFKDTVSTSADYWLTDDVPEMAMLNDGSPCWILTKSPTDAGGREIAKKIRYFPMFSRDLILFGRNYGNIVHSWNFGHPQIIYSPDTYSTDGDSIYDVSWKDYIRDLYDVNTRKLTCYVRAEMDNRPWPWWLRRFYWFENSLWRLNEIKDLNIGTFDTTKMEFIKVLDMNDYKLKRIEYQGNNSIVLNQDMVPCTGGTITGTVYIQSAGGWVAGEYISGRDLNGNYYYLDIADVMTPTRGRGEYATDFTINMPQNTGDTPITWILRVVDDFDAWISASFIQDTCNTASTITILPGATIAPSYTSQVSFTTYYVRVTGVTVASDSAWATASLSGDTITVICANNPTSSDRTATITVSGTGTEGTISASATVTQRGLGGVVVNHQNIDIDYNDTGETSFNILTDDDWTSTINDN